MPATDLLAQLRQLLAIEQAARIVSPSVAAPLSGIDAGMPSAPAIDPLQADAMILGLLASARDDELLAARHAAGAAGASQEAAWLADEIDRRGIAAG